MSKGASLKVKTTNNKTALKMSRMTLLNLEGEQNYSPNEGPRKKYQNPFSKIILSN
jgi:hypothetical protein